MRAKYDWETIKRKYIEGIVNKDGTISYPTLRDLSAEYGMDISVIGRRSKADQWTVQREIFVNKINMERQQKKAETISDEGSAFDLKCFNISQDAADRVHRMIQEADKPAELSMLSQALKNLQTVGKAALGDKDGQQDGITIKVSVSDAD